MYTNQSMYGAHLILGTNASTIDRKIVEVKHPIYMNATYLVPDC